MALSLDLTGKVVLVTGGTRGIGRGITSAFLDAGASVVTCSRSDVEPVPGSTHRVCDVRDPEAVTALVEAVVSEQGRLDVLVNNAGGAPSTDAATASPRFHDKILALNLSAPLMLAQAANRVMQEQGSGAIVNISSIARQGSFGQTNYAAAKAGVVAMAEVWARELARFNIRTGVVAPGTINTDMIAAMKPEARDRLVSSVPLKRLGEPEHIARSVQFIFENDYFTGRVIETDGGLR